MAAGGAEVPRGGISLAGDHMAENVEALMPMISAHFIDAKVRHTHTVHIFSTWDEHTMINFLYVFSFLSGWIRTGLKQFRSSPQQESNRKVASPQQRHDGPSWKWCKSSPSPPTQSPLLFFILISHLFHFYCIPSDWKQSQPLRARENRPEVRPELNLGAAAPVLAGDHLWAGVPVRELQRQRRQPRNGRLGTLL